MQVEDNIRRLYETMVASDYILLGAGAGLSAAAGISFADEKAFAREYPVLWQKGIHSDYQTFSYRDWPPEQQWAYWARHIQAVRFDTPPLPLYAELLALLEGFDYHIITSNVDRQFYRSGFPMERVHEAQGTYDQLICSQLCTEEEWPIGPVIAKMQQAIDPERFVIPQSLLPVCPHCGAPLRMAFRDIAGYDGSLERYRSFLRRSEAGSICIIEIGVGFNSPGVIRVPFERITGERDNARFFRITVDYPDSEEEIAYPEIPRPIADKSLSINEDAGAVIRALLAMKRASEKDSVR